MTLNMTLENARVLVVGASSGIGRALAEHALAQGARVSCAARRTELLNEVIEGHPNGFAITADIRNAEDCRRIVAESVASMGGLDLVVSCAGVGSLGNIEAPDPQEWRRDYDVNVVGPTLIAGAALEFLSPDGIIALMSSESVGETRWGLSSYTASKAALDATVRNWRVEHPQRRFQRIVMGAAFPTDFGAQYGGPILDTAMQQWLAAGISSEMMDCNTVGQHLAAMFGVMLAIPGVDIPDICYDPRGVPIAAAPVL